MVIYAYFCGLTTHNPSPCRASIYGLSIYYYTYAQRVIGAARTSAYYAIAPFIGMLLSMLILGERPGSTFFVALAIMLIGTYLASGKNEDGML